MGQWFLIIEIKNLNSVAKNLRCVGIGWTSYTVKLGDKEQIGVKEPFQRKFGVKEQFKGDQKVTKIRNNLLTLFNIWVTSKWIKYLQKINLTSISFYVSIKVFTLWPPKFRGLPMPLFQFVFTVYRTIKKSCSTWILKSI